MPRMRIRRPWCLAALLASAVAGCAAPRRPPEWAAIHERTPSFLDSLAAAADPAVAADPHGRVALTFVTRGAAGGKDLWVSISRDTGATFTRPARVNETAGSVASYPEGRPVPAFGPAGGLLVAWADKRQGVERAVDVAARASGDGGATFGPTAYLNDDRAGGIPAYHGFPAVAFRGDGSLFAAWLDERQSVDPGGEPTASSLFSATSLDGGQTWSANRKLRDSVCSCCRPAVAIGARGGVAVAYRNARRNLRDPGLAVSTDGGTSFADTVLHADGWYLTGCPDVGPALAWDRPGGGQCAWYTGAVPAGVFVVPWRAAGGAAGVRRALSDSLERASHPRLVPFGDSSLIGVEARPASDTTRAVLAVRALDPAGTLTPWMFLGANVASGWLATADGRSAFACWVERDQARERVRLVRLVRR